jgi:hypothetical protein
MTVDKSSIWRIDERSSCEQERVTVALLGSMRKSPLSLFALATTLKKRDLPGRWFDVGIKVVGEIWRRRMRK